MLFFIDFLSFGLIIVLAGFIEGCFFSDQKRLGVINPNNFLIITFIDKYSIYGLYSFKYL